MAENKLNLELMKSDARAFYKAAERCNEKRQLPDRKIDWLAVPVIVNLSISAELYLKYLIAKNVIPPDEPKPVREHKLAELFDLLDSTTQNEIINANNYGNDKFKELLNEHSKAFIEWRYLHEQNQNMNVDTLFLANLIHSLEFIANKP
ncbi:HEPN domain-containing protein [Methanosarcina mazei]|jgi:hypothetical protein|uniref:HEPN domain-containing protein n=1 Tax=Methanosarcina mazei TaxID=2209 RepID=A0A0F8F0Y4_METMZ|nr:HEPN domain-containing protein [Methanosarcina mazei]KKG14088.1 hypothetical protein DU34_10400 [Methanosarcina mazei]KKG35164.1 hypothetical protein DU49_17455 [Methanosarcina mazei]KKG40063.1 hypothetical protein DU39_11270 [Methanosarcina mazei]KKG44565.1 hypothetical protein DU35_11655 [Methanosarcina mazei]KKG45751.1 hypothetical protein DU41_02520 [Methanosarcina mazei]